MSKQNIIKRTDLIATTQIKERIYDNSHKKVVMNQSYPYEKAVVLFNP